MKKLLLFTVFVGSLISCQGPAEKGSEHSHESTVIGYEFNDKGEKQNLIAGDVSITETYMEFIKAHNDRDIDKIMNMVQDSILIKTQDARLLKGKATHRQVLEEWFPESNPMWTVNWMVTNTVEVKDGENRNWLTTGIEIVETIDDKEITREQILDVNFVGKMIKEVSIYERSKPIE
jgi:hypothetical protein|tara:strand:- start:8 stop:538 length:531 start_codon:yes stop_codon:yes gene_type:complete